MKLLIREGILFYLSCKNGFELQERLFVEKKKAKRNFLLHFTLSLLLSISVGTGFQSHLVDKMSESSSISKGPIVAKILIDLSEYLALKKAKQLQDENEDRLSKSYENKVANVVEEQSEDSEEEGHPTISSHHSKAVAPVQIGNGIDFKELIIDAISEGFKSIVQNQMSSFQSGGSFAPNNLSDLAPAPPQTIANDDHQPSSGFDTLIKSDENDTGDENNLIGKIPKKFRSRAKKLLEASNKNSASFSWNSDGIIFVNGESLPLSNIFVLLPELYKSNPNKELPGFYEVVKQLANLGLGHLINKSILRGLRRTGPLENQTLLFNYVQQNPGKWFFLG